MRFKEINLDDFGCFLDASCTDIENGLSVIAGPQRAGKTTFMHAVRRIGYGIEQGANVPPATDRYALSAIVEYGGHDYRLEIDHYADPHAVAVDGGPERSARELFGDIRKEQYRQLYTISLDELRQDPDSLDKGTDLSRVLLGAGFGEASHIPDIIEELGSDAHDIGRTTGLQGGQIRDAIKTIESGMDDRDDAIAQVDEYEDTEAEVARIEDRIDELRAEQDMLADERTRLEFVHNEYENVTRLRELRRTLDEADIGALEQFPIADLERVRTLAEQYAERRRNRRSAESQFDTRVGRDDADEYRERLLSGRADIERCKEHLERYRRDVQTLQEAEDEQDETTKTLIHRISDLHPTWDSLADIRSADTDLPAIGSIREHVRTYRKWDGRVEEYDDDIATLETQIAELDERIETAVESTEFIDLNAFVPRGIGAGVIAVIAGAISGLLNPLLGVLVTAGMLLVAGIWVFRSLVSTEPAHDGVNVEHLRGQQQERDADLEAAKEQRAAAIADRDAAREELDAVRREYDLPADMDPDTLEAFIEELLDLEEAIHEFDRTQSGLESQRTDVQAELTEVADRLHDIGVLDEEIAAPVDHAERVFTAIERADDHLEEATAVETARTEVASVEDEIATYLVDGLDEPPEPGDPDFPDAVQQFVQYGTELEAVAGQHAERQELKGRIESQLENERLAAAFGPITAEGDDPLAGLERVYDDYESADAIAERVNEITSRNEDLEDALEQHTERRVELESRLADLRSDADVREAHETMQRGRSRLEDTLESYAEYRIAEQLLDTLQERYIERTTGPLLEEASEIFSRITDGAYRDVESTNEFDHLDFRSYRSDDRTHTSTELSRATAEQLFLAIRLARIKREPEPLPVLIDDSLTNFDPGHVHRTLEVLTELADERQMFLLTCHPVMLDQVAACYDAQYYTLDGGRFDGPETDYARARQFLEERSPAPYPQPEPRS